jgi:hypothetical protein
MISALTASRLLGSSGRPLLTCKWAGWVSMKSSFMVAIEILFAMATSKVPISMPKCESWGYVITVSLIDIHPAISDVQFSGNLAHTSAIIGDGLEFSGDFKALVDYPSLTQQRHFEVDFMDDYTFSFHTSEGTTATNIASSMLIQ